MQKNSQDFSMSDAMKLAQSPAAQQLLAMLRSTDAALLEEVSQHAKAGDFSQASQLLQKLLSSPESQALLNKLGR